nr:FAD-dependent oxidoreductase [uncultured Rhodopila sp.]
MIVTNNHFRGVTVNQALDIAVVGSGISGLSAAWLLRQRHRVTLYESAPRPGGHSNTVEVRFGDTVTSVDTGFIVYNEVTYPNLTALFSHLGVATNESEMSFAVSLDGGRLEYGGNDLRGLFGQPINLIRPRFWSMLRDLRRFYRDAPGLADRLPGHTSLGELLDSNGYGEAFQQDHLLPMAGAIWSASAATLRDYPARHFIRFCENHGLLKFTDRPIWRTVAGGSRTYVERLVQAIDNPRLGVAAQSIRRQPDSVVVRDSAGESRTFDHVVLACHADHALALLEQPTEPEATLLGAFEYTSNRAVLHSDPRLMPRRKAVWSSWNYLGRSDEPDELHVTYWMNRLQDLGNAPPLFVTLNPAMEPLQESVHLEQVYEHPRFDAGAMRAQEALWSLQGRQRTWFCGAWFGAGFHEDGLQAGLAVAEQLGGVRRPWTVADENGRIRVTQPELAA